MAERVLVSPGVFDREIDGTVRSADVQGIGPVIIGPRAKGPAMVPVVTKDVDTDLQFFGPPNSNGKDFAAYANRIYLNQKTNPSTFIRVLGQAGTNVTTGFSVNKVTAIGASGSAASGSNVIVLIHSSGSVTLAGTLTSSSDSLAIDIAGYGAVTASLNRNSSNYIKKVLNTDPTQYSTHKHYVYAVFDYGNKTPGSHNAFFAAELPSVAASYTDSFITGATTTVISQPFGATEYNLFGFGSIFAGDTANEEVKVTIANIKKSPNPNQNEFGTFTVIVRKFYDNDRQAEVLETFTNVDLNPESRNYIVRRIGDRYKTFNTSTKKFDMFGDYPNKSRYIYVTPSTDLKNGNVPATALPYGFNGYKTLSRGAASDKAAFPELPFVQTLSFKGNFTTKVCWGIELINNASGAINHGVVDRLRHLASGIMAVSSSTDTKFSLKWLSGATGLASGYAAATRLTENQINAMSTSVAYNTGTASPTGGTGGYLSLENIENTAVAKFTLPIADGFDGINIHSADPFSSEDMLTNLAYQTHAYRTAVDIISNPDELDVNELAMPGVYASKVTDYALEKIEDRGDMFYLMDASGSTVSDFVNNVVDRQVDTNYASVWYPYVRFFDDVNDKYVDVPPTVVMPAVLAFNDKVAYPWFAPAGFNRGGLAAFGVTEAKDKLNKADRDRLYENRINPIATFKQGTVVWGQKTLQVAPSALDRINVRRMLLNVRKVIAREALNIVFEPNVPKTWEKFTRKVEPFLRRVRENSGIDDFKLVLDNSTTTEDLIERNIMYGKIAIKPTRAAEYILLDFFVTNNVAGFQE
jgi:hypothetical protein